MRVWVLPPPARPPGVCRYFAPSVAAQVVAELQEALANTSARQTFDALFLLETFLPRCVTWAVQVAVEGKGSGSVSVSASCMRVQVRVRV
jgi:hypothetical protein